MAPASTRRPQEERRAETRSRLLDATIESLLEVGYQATTTRRVSELAGVSQGAQTHHFPHRVDLMASAVEHLAEQRLEALTLRVEELPAPPADRARRLLDLLWDDFSSSVFAVFVKLWVAAADDAELYERLVPVERRLRRSIAAGAYRAGGELAEGELEWETRLLVVLSALRGLALSERFEPRGERSRVQDPWPEVRPVLERVLRGPA